MSAESEEAVVNYRPTLRDMVMLQTPVEVRLTADGSKVAVMVRTTNWRKNRYEYQCQVHDLQRAAAWPITRSGDVLQMAWIDDQTLALLREGIGDDDAQVWLYEGLAGEGWPATDHKNGVEWFAPFAGGLLYLASDPKREENKERAAKFGKFTHFEQEESSTALYYVNLEKLKAYRQQEKACTEEEAEELIKPVIELSQLLEEPLALQTAYPSPTGDAVYLNCWVRDDLVYLRETSAFQIRLDPQRAIETFIQRQRDKAAAEDGEKSAAEDDHSYLGVIRRLNIPRAAAVRAVSPDGERLLISYQGRDDKMYTLRDQWIIGVEEALGAVTAEEFLKGMVNISAPLDREVLERYWVRSGIFGAYVDRTRVELAHFSEGGDFSILDLGGYAIEESFHASDSGVIAFIGASRTTFPEVYVAGLPDKDGKQAVTQLSDFGRALENWELGTVETIRWLSKDGTEIEGVLRKPANFDPERRYPLVFIVHGGPRWFSEEYLLTSDDISYYPSVQFVHKDILVLKPNYRGSRGRGQAFTELNVGNLGTGDLWDLESAIEHLAGLGLVDETRIGCMGWSQGGYISAFAGLHSKKFAAVSVGAGISDWYTYHIGNDIPDFTVDYLSISPFRDRAPYEKSSPISKLAEAQTPILIQHRSGDRRVPVANAMELYRGLKEMHVPVELYIFPGTGHSITRPRENHAVMFQNLAWFSHYLLGEELQLE